MHNENLNQYHQSANFNKSYASFIAPRLGKIRPLFTYLKDMLPPSEAENVKATTPT